MHSEVICEISQEDYILLHIIYGELLPIFYADVHETGY
jgi:hypothetical protein